MLQKHLIQWVMDEAIHSSDWFYFSGINNSKTTKLHLKEKPTKFGMSFDSENALGIITLANKGIIKLFLTVSKQTVAYISLVCL